MANPIKILKSLSPLALRDYLLYSTVEANSPHLDGSKIASILSKGGFTANKVPLISVTSVMAQTTTDCKTQHFGRWRPYTGDIPYPQFCVGVKPPPVGYHIEFENAIYQLLGPGHIS